MEAMMNGKNNEVLRKHTADMSASERHVLEMLERQVVHSDIVAQPQVRQHLETVTGTLRRHLDAIEKLLEDLGGDGESTMKQAVTAVSGAISGMIGNMRSETASKILRDEYIALNVLEISYTMLHTTALALGSKAAADLAAKHLSELPALIIESGDLVPKMLVLELPEEGVEVISGVASQTVELTHKIWAN
jgi:ferritin-like metal-binding protein YciE